jgi:xanthine dehydrogenase accessory factor
MGQDASEDPWSVTEKDLREQLRRFRDTETEAAVVTVAAVNGSAYRRPGAKMLVPADADTVGAVTAGCLEGPVVDIATEVLENGSPRLEVFDLLESDDDNWGLGLGCNGIIDVFVEPLDASLDRALATLADGESVTLVTVVESTGNPSVGSRSTIGSDWVRRDLADRDPIPASILESISETTEAAHGTGATRTVELDVEGGAVTLLVDSLQPLSELLLFGSQNDLPPLARLADDVGFRVTVHSPRGTVDETTVPHADTVTTGHPSTVADSLTVDEHTYAVVMSHNLIDDRIAVESLLSDTDVPYVGLMGPRSRFEKLRASMADDGVTLSQSALDRLSTPVGLDLGGGEPLEIALSVVSEVLAVSNGRGGGRLRDRDGPIHPRVMDE